MDIYLVLYSDLLGICLAFRLFNNISKFSKSVVIVDIHKERVTFQTYVKITVSSDSPLSLRSNPRLDLNLIHLVLW